MSKNPYKRFTVVVEKIGRRRWRLVKELVFRDAAFYPEITVPVGFVTDFASVPRIPLAFALFGNRGHAAAVVHDWLYQTHPEGMSKADADYVFYEALRAEGLKHWRAEMMYLAVKFCGRSAWNSGPDRLKIQKEWGG